MSRGRPRTRAPELGAFVDALRDVLGLAPIGGEPYQTDEERFRRATPEYSDHHEGRVVTHLRH